MITTVHSPSSSNEDSPRLVPCPASVPQGSPARKPAIDVARIERAVREILLAVGESPDRDGLRETPARVARSYVELFGGLHESAGDHLGRVFQQEHDEFVLVRDIPVVSMCEHHLLPFMGRAHVAYLPRHGQVVGLSKLGRAVEVFARRPQVQERLTNQVADAVMDHLRADGAAVIVEAEHLCMKVRGVKHHGSTTMTVATRGCFRDDPLKRAEVMAAMRHRGGALGVSETLS